MRRLRSTLFWLGFTAGLIRAVAKDVVALHEGRKYQ